MFKSFVITLCRVFITQQKIRTPLSAKRYSCVICAFLNSLCNWDSFRLCVFMRAVCVCVCVCLCVCVCVVCVCVSVVFLMLFRQLPYLKFCNKIFAANWSQIRVFSEDLITYILSLKNCNTKKGNKNYKKTPTVSL